MLRDRKANAAIAWPKSGFFRMPTETQDQGMRTWMEPRQRFLQRDGQRMSVRLEEEFWDVLEFSAKDQRVKLADLVFRLSRENPAGNRSSMLRTHCARWMRQKLAALQLASGNADIQGILTSCPIPCVVVTREKRLIARNNAFAEKILGSLAAPDQWADAESVVRFSLGRPIDHMIRDLTDRKSTYVETNVAFSRGSAIVQMVGRFCLMTVASTEASPLLCFLYLRARS